MKPVIWLANSLSRVRQFPATAKRIVGHQLERVQAGNEPWDWKPMPSIGIGVNEIRVRSVEGAFRVIYVAKLAGAVYVLHAFQKKSSRTPAGDIDLARKRFGMLIEEMRRQ